jgi:hypothetical protein
MEHKCGGSLAMNYSISAIETKYKGVLFRSRLEAKWASFFDVLGWQWDYEPCDLPRWSPDFFIEIERQRRNSVEIRRISLLAEIKPYSTAPQFNEHEFTKHLYGHPLFHCDACVGFGVNPGVTLIELESDSESSVGEVPFEYLVDGELQVDVTRLWRKACNRVRWKFDGKGRRV